MTPAARIIDQFGVEALARWTGRHRSRIHAWTWSRERGGTGGVVPVALRAKIIASAQVERAVALSFADFEPREGESYLLAVEA